MTGVPYEKYKGPFNDYPQLSAKWNESAFHSGPNFLRSSSNH